LAELTSNKTYLNAALLSATFLRDMLMTPSNLIAQQIDVQACQSNATRAGLAYSGVAIHAWAVLADVAGDARWRDLYAPCSRRCGSECADRMVHASAVDVLVAASQTTMWATADGICDAERAPLLSFGCAALLTGAGHEQHGAEGSSSLQTGHRTRVRLAGRRRATTRSRSPATPGTFMRSLYELWVRNSGNATLSAYISAYIAVQAGPLSQLDDPP
jgi:hypothetical protein